MEDSGANRIDEMREVCGQEGEWVVLVGNEIIARDFDAQKMFKLAEKYEDRGAEVIKVLYPGASFY